MTNQQIDPKVAAIVKALAYTENGGAPDLKNPSAGQSGELKSVFQFMPDTWKVYTKQMGEENLPMTPENETKVVYSKVQHWLSQGYDVNQIASMWNAGEQKPDAYKYNRGTNKQGVPFNTIKYAKKVSDYTQKFQNDAGVSTSETSSNPEPLAVATQDTQSGMVQPAPFTLKQQKPPIVQKGLMKKV